MADSSGGAHRQDTNGHRGHDSSTAMALKHNPGISSDWTAEEQTILEDGLIQYRGEQSITLYAKIAMLLQNKTVRDVALRCRWMTKKENSKRRKGKITERKSKERKETVSDPSLKQSHFMASPNALPYASPMVLMDIGSGISYNVAGGVIGELLEQNARAINQISANLSTMQVQENISLLGQTRDNIHKIMNELNESPDVMKQMPPLPFKLNEALASTLLPHPGLQ